MEMTNDEVRRVAAPAEPAVSPAHATVMYPTRQPLLDAEGLLRGFELVLREDEEAAAAPVAPATDVRDELRLSEEAAARVLGALGARGVYTALAGHRGYLNASRALLFSDAFTRISPDRYHFELAPDIEVDPALIARLVGLHAKRHRFVLDHVTQPNETFAKLLPYVHAVKIDVARVTPGLLPKLVAALKSAGKLLIALNVDSPEQFDEARELGFDLFQGYFFASPHKQTTRRASAPRQALLNLLRLLSADPSVAQLEAELKLNPVLVMHLMRLANSGEGSIGRKVATLREAINATGTNRIARWTQLLLYADGRKVRLEDDPLVQLAASRARFIELAATRLAHATRKTVDGAFLTGVFSLVGVVFGDTLENTLDALALSSHIHAAILHREGTLGTLLNAIEALERGDWAALDHAAAMLEPLSSADLTELAITAAAWASSSDQSDEHAGLDHFEE